MSQYKYPEHKDVLINAGHINVKGFFNHQDNSPRSPNVPIDPVAQAMAAEIMYTYNPQTLEEFKQRAVEHLRKRESKGNLIIGGIKNG